MELPSLLRNEINQTVYYILLENCQEHKAILTALLRFARFALGNDLEEIPYFGLLDDLAVVMYGLSI